MKITYKTVTNFAEDQELEIEGALHIIIGETKLRITDRDGVLKISGESQLLVCPEASNMVTITEKPY